MLNFIRDYNIKHYPLNSREGKSVYCFEIIFSKNVKIGEIEEAIDNLRKKEKKRISEIYTEDINTVIIITTNLEVKEIVQLSKFFFTGLIC